MNTANPPSTPTLDALLSQLQIYKDNFLTQTQLAFSRLTPQGIIRLVIIVGAYCLLRPYLIKLGGKFQAKDHERALDMEEVERLRKAEGIGNDKGESLKGRVQIPHDTDSEADEGEEEGARGSGVDWGKKARRRQRRVMRELVEAEGRRRKEEEEAASDKEIEEFLTG